MSTASLGTRSLAALAQAVADALAHDLRRREVLQGAGGLEGTPLGRIDEHGRPRSRGFHGHPSISSDYNFMHMADLPSPFGQSRCRQRQWLSMHPHSELVPDPPPPAGTRSVRAAPHTTRDQWTRARVAMAQHVPKGWPDACERSRRAPPGVRTPC
jgi:hypothetical protein